MYILYSYGRFANERVIKQSHTHTVTGIPIDLPPLQHRGIQIANEMNKGKNVQFLGQVPTDVLIEEYKPAYHGDIGKLHSEYIRAKLDAIEDDLSTDKKQRTFWGYLLRELLIYRQQFINGDEVFERVRSLDQLDEAWNELIRRFVKKVVEVDSTM